MTLLSNQTRPQGTGTAVVLIVMAVFLMAAQDALIKYASPGMTLGQIFVWRSVIVLPVLSVIAGRAMSSAWRTAFGFWPVARGGCLTGMYLVLYAAIPHLPLSTLAAGFYTGPLFITLLSAAILGEPVGTRGWSAIGIGFAGVLILLRPGVASFTPIVLLPVLSGFCYALAAILARGKCRDHAPVALALSLNICLLGAGVLMGGLGYIGLPVAWSFLAGPWVEMGNTEWGLVILLAALMVGIGLALAMAYQLGRPVIVAAFDYSYLIFATLFGVALFAERPDAPTVMGMILIGGAGLWSAREGARGQAS